jgi:hypothetical protein
MKSINRRGFIGSGLMSLIAVPSIVEASSTLPRHTRNETIAVSCDGEHWFEAIITPDDLANANVNAQGGRELSMEVPDSGDLTYQYVKSSAQVLGAFVGIAHLPTDFVCELIVFIIIVVVAGIIYYYLVKMCKSKLGDPPKNGS